MYVCWNSTVSIFQYFFNVSLSGQLVIKKNAKMNLLMEVSTKRVEFSLNNINFLKHIYNQKVINFHFTDRFLPLLEQLKPTLLQQLQQSLNKEQGQGQGESNNKIPGRPGVDYPDFKVIPVTDFSCENFILEGFYADTFTSCQVKLPPTNLIQNVS